MAETRKPGALYFTDIICIDTDTATLIGHYYAFEDSDEERTVLLSLKKGVWGSLNVSGIAHAVRFDGKPNDPKRQTFILDRNRGLYRVTSKGVQFDRINEDRQGFLMDLRQISGQWYTVGGHHQIYRQEKSGWRAIDTGVYVSGEAGEAKLLLSIDGLTSKDIYAVGFNGVILHFDGTKWSNLDSPTNVGLQRVLCVTKDEVYICGYGNSLYRGNTKGWLALTEPDDSVVFWDMAYFKGRLYVCTKKALYMVNSNDELEEVEIPVKGPLGFYRMDASDKELWTCGNECVLRFDGKKWSQYIFPDNK